MTNSLVMSAFRLFGQAEGALANGQDHLAAARKTWDLTELGRAIRQMRRATETTRDAMSDLIASPEKGDPFSLQLLKQLQEQRRAVYVLQEAIPAFLNGMAARPLRQRIAAIIGNSERGLTCDAIAQALRAECVAMAEAKADWHLAMGAPVAWVLPGSSPDPEQVRRLLGIKEQDAPNFRRRAFSLPGRWTALAA